MRLLFALLFFVLPMSAFAQQRDFIFDNYAAYQNFVDTKVASKDFGTMIATLGGRREYTEDQLVNLDRQFKNIYKNEFVGGAVTKSIDLGNGFRQEMRVYWDSGLGYLYYYAMLHDRGNVLVVLHFSMNTDVEKVLSKF